MALFQATVTIWLLFAVINGALLMGVQFGENLCNEQPHISCGWVNQMKGQGLNSTNLDLNVQNFTSPDDTLVANLTDPANKTFSNHTGNDDVLDPIIDNTDSVIFVTQNFLRFFTQACPICNTVDVIADAGDFAWPSGMTFMIVSGLAITNAVVILYLVTGRSI